MGPTLDYFLGLSISKLLATFERPVAGPRSEVFGRADGVVSVVLILPIFSRALKKFVKSCEVLPELSILYSAPPPNFSINLLILTGFLLVLWIIVYAKAESCTSRSLSILSCKVGWMRC